jgi:hypothetical protein
VYLVYMDVLHSRLASCSVARQPLLDIRIRILSLA